MLAPNETRRSNLYFFDLSAIIPHSGTKNTLIKYARQLGLYTVLRYFVVDSMALSNIEKQMGGVQPDVIEILPGIMPGIIKRVNKISKVPVIAGGLIADRGDVMTALNSGAIAISATSQEIWFL